MNIAREFGDIAHYQVGPLHVYQLNHPDFARQILVEEPEKFYKPRLIKQAFGPFAGQGLLTSDGAMWKQQRKLIQPAFHHAQLVTYGAVMVGHALRMIDSLEDGAVVEIQEVMARLTLAIVVQTLFGADVTREAKEVGRLMVAVLDSANDRLNRILRLPSWVPTRRNLQEKRALARLDELLDSFIAAHRASSEKPADLLSVLLAATDEDSGSRMSDSQLHEEMMTLFLAGHETTAMALTWTWYLLSQHPEVEERLVREVSRVLRGRAPTVADLPQLPYTEMVVRESHALVSASGGFRARADRGRPHRRIQRPTQAALSPSTRMRFTATRAFSTSPNDSTPSVFSRLGRAHPALRLSPVRRRPACLHRQRLCDDGGAADIGDGRCNAASCRSSPVRKSCRCNWSPCVRSTGSG